MKYQIQYFENLWKDGYYEGDPLDPMAQSSYGQLNFMSVLHATYLRCIKPYVNSESISLEIGPGRGAWTKVLLPSKEIYALDAVSAEQNGFFEYIGQEKHVNYIQVSDFECNMLPENHFNYMFSFGCLCHVSFEGISQYAKNIYPKLKPGSNCFWLIADYKKYNQAINNLEYLSIWERVKEFEPGSKSNLIKPLLKLFKKFDQRLPLQIPDESMPGRWFDAGIDKTCSMLEEVGYKVIDSDVGTVHRDPIIHFMKVT
jgi:hypothetical protein